MATLSGCATVESIDFPWENNAPTGSRSVSADTEPPDTSEAQSGSSADHSEAALYWASRAVSASRRVAYAAGVQNTARSAPEALASSATDVSAPYGRWQTDSSATETQTAVDESPEPSSEEVATAPERRSVEREPDETSPAGTNSNDTSPAEPVPSEAEDSAGAEATTAATEPSPSDSSQNEQEPRTTDAGSHGWPVGFPDGGVRDRGTRTLVDPRVETNIYQLDNSEDRSNVVSRWGLNPPDADGAVAIPGTFVQNIRQYSKYDDLDDEQLDNQVAVVVPGRSVSIYAGERQVASKKLPDSGDLPDQLARVHPVRIVEDGTTQLLVFWNETSSEKNGPLEYRVGLLKAIGPRIGTIFERTVATRSSSSGDLRRAGYVDFLRGANHRLVQWTPATDGGEPDSDEAAVLEWNQWEGVFRTPKPPPTAPEQRS